MTAPISSDQAAPVLAHHAKYLAPDGYDIRHDPEAANKIAALLLDGYVRHPGRPVLLGRALGSKDVWAIRWHVECLRRLGWVIEARKGIPGYTLVGFRAPKPWTHLDRVQRDVYAEMTAGSRQTAESPLPGQLELV